MLRTQISLTAEGRQLLDAEATRTGRSISAPRAVPSTLVWHLVDQPGAEQAGALGRRWLPSHHEVDGADLAIAATAMANQARLLTLNVRHFPMFAGPEPPYVRG